MRNGRVLVKDGASTERTVRELRLRILRGELVPGEQIRQEELACRMNLSRVPVREALSVLANEGILTHHRHQGYFVTKRTPEELAQIRLMLSLLERELTRTVSWPDNGFLDHLRALNSHMDSLAESDSWTDMVPINYEFHLAIFGCSPLNLILDEVRRLWALADPYIALDYATVERRRHTIAQHERIIKALAARNRTRLLKAVEDHQLATSKGALASLNRVRS
ncbi:MAG TPA: GntR family transcriptional regulator [Rugosimonospora sp.]|nr:GntR family transcriptional regulator [Rugosimonospora sp.]